MKNFLKGFVIGIGKIVPGVSGALLAISLGIYDKALECICNFLNNKKESIRFLFPIGLGIILSIIFFSRVISFFLAKYFLITMLFFIGLIIGGVPSVYFKVNKKDYYIVVISFIIFFLLSISGSSDVYVIRNDIVDYIVFFLSGVLEAIGTVVPGVSSTALLMIIGTYNTVISSIGNLNNFYVLIPFCVGFVVGIVFIVKIVYYLIRKCENKMYAFVFGVLLASIVLLIIRSFENGVCVGSLFVGLILMVVGIFIGNVMDKK